MAESDSADPKQLLNDLRQIAAVCQRLGIDLGKVAAMGQTIGGKGKGQGPYETQNEGHSQFHDGGGTGYTNMASGAIAGSAMSSSMASRVRVLDKIKKGRGLGQLTPPERDIAEKMSSENIALGNAIRMRDSSSTPEERASHQNMIDRMNGMRAKGNFGLPPPHVVEASKGPGKKKSSLKKSQTNVMGQIADKATRRMMMSMLTIQGLESALTGAQGVFMEPLHQLQGETWALRGAGVAASAFKMGTSLASASVAMQMATNVTKAMRVAKGLGTLAKVGRAAMAAGPQIAILAAIETANIIIDQTMSHAKLSNEMKYSLAAERQGRIGPLQGRTTDDAGYVHPEKIRPMTAEQVERAQKFYQDQADEYYIDDWGHRNKRSALGSAWRRALRGIDEGSGWIGWGTLAPFKIMNRWGLDDDLKKNQTQDAAQADESHKQGMQYAEFMDWKSAKWKFDQAMKVTVSEQDQKFAWKQPEVYLANMESARISGRNWARSQQPRGGDRTGD